MAYQPDIFDAKRSEERRDISLKRVGYDSDFMLEGIRAIKAMRICMPPNGEVMGEDIRELLAEQNIAPHHPNAWGSLIRSAVKQGLLVETGEWRKSRSVRSNARRMPVYRIA